MPPASRTRGSRAQWAAVVAASSGWSTPPARCRTTQSRRWPRSSRPSSRTAARSRLTERPGTSRWMHRRSCPGPWRVRRCMPSIGFGPRSGWPPTVRPAPEAETGLRGLHDAMRRGDLDSYRAGVVAEELEEAPAQVAAAVVATLGDHLVTDAAPQLRRRCRTVLSRISPDLVRRARSGRASAAPCGGGRKNRASTSGRAPFRPRMPPRVGRDRCPRPPAGRRWHLRADRARTLTGPHRPGHRLGDDRDNRHAHGSCTHHGPGRGPRPDRPRPGRLRLAGSVPRRFDPVFAVDGAEGACDLPQPHTRRVRPSACRRPARRPPACRSPACRRPAPRVRRMTWSKSRWEPGASGSWSPGPSWTWSPWA